MGQGRVECPSYGSMRQPQVLHVDLTGLGALVVMIICTVAVMIQSTTFSSCHPSPPALPFSRSTDLVVDHGDKEAQVVMNGNNVYVDGELMAYNFEEYRPDLPPIPGLLYGLQRKAARLDGKEGREQGGRLATIFADKEVPFGLLLRVLHTCRQAGFDRTVFRVRREWTKPSPAEVTRWRSEMLNAR